MSTPTTTPAPEVRRPEACEAFSPPNCHGCTRSIVFVLAGKSIVDCGIEGEELTQAMGEFRTRGRCSTPFEVVASKAPGRIAAWPLHFEPEAIASCTGFTPRPELLRAH